MSHIDPFGTHTLQGDLDSGGDCKMAADSTSCEDPPIQLTLTCSSPTRNQILSSPACTAAPTDLLVIPTTAPNAVQSKPLLRRNSSSRRSVKEDVIGTGLEKKERRVIEAQKQELDRLHLQLDHHKSEDAKRIEVIKTLALEKNQLQSEIVGLQHQQNDFYQGQFNAYREDCEKRMSCWKTEYEEVITSQRRDLEERGNQLQSLQLNSAEKDNEFKVLQGNLESRIKTFQDQWDDMKKINEDALSFMKQAEGRAMEAERALEIERKRMGEEMAEILRKISQTRSATPQQPIQATAFMETEEGGIPMPLSPILTQGSKTVDDYSHQATPTRGVSVTLKSPFVQPAPTYRERLQSVGSVSPDSRQHTLHGLPQNTLLGSAGSGRERSTPMMEDDEMETKERAIHPSHSPRLSDSLPTTPTPGGARGTDILHPIRSKSAYSNRLKALAPPPVKRASVETSPVVGSLAEFDVLDDRQKLSALFALMANQGNQGPSPFRKVGPKNNFRDPIRRAEKPEGRNERLKFVRERINILIGITKDDEIMIFKHEIYATDSLIKRQMVRYEQTRDPRYAPVLRPMIINFESVSNAWNMALFELFRDYAQDQGYNEGELLPQDEQELQAIFFKRLERLHGIVKLHEPRPGEAERDAQRRALARRHEVAQMARRTSRRTELGEARQRAILRNAPGNDTIRRGIEHLSYQAKSWVDAHNMHQALGLEGMSSDDSDGDDSVRVVRHMEWRNPDVIRRYKMVDENRTQMTTWGKRLPGTTPQQRKRRRDAGASTRPPPTGKPWNLYNPAWYAKLTSLEKEQLKAGPVLTFYTTANDDD